MPRPRSPIPPCEAVPALDVRRFKREGKLRPGHSSIISWVRDGEREPCVRVRLTADDAAVTLAFKTTDGALVHQRIALTRTAQRLGGERSWFACGCGRRVAMLYVVDRPVFACRRCHALKHAATRESARLSGLTRARKIREALGGGHNLLDSVPPRPAGMRHAKYARPRTALEAAEVRLGLRRRKAPRSLGAGGQ
jgi:hypothetical protein